MTLPLNLVLVRHGQSEGNAAKRLSEGGDHTAYSPEFRMRHTSGFRLTAQGRSQARRAGTWMRLNGLDSFDRFMVSSYVRAKETAGLLDLPQADWMLDSYLTERNWGDVDNLPEDERNARFGEALAKQISAPFFWRPPNGESFHDLCLRVDRVLDTLHRECSNQNVVLVCHGEVMRAFQVRLERLTPEQFKQRVLSDEYWERIHNCQITHYTRVEPSSGRVSAHADWVRIIRPTEGPARVSEWRTIERRRYSNEELLELALKWTEHRVMHHEGKPFTQNPRVRRIRTDESGLTIVEAQLDEGEAVCWRCGAIAYDPEKTLQKCPECGGAFND